MKRKMLIVLGILLSVAFLFNGCTSTRNGSMSPSYTETENAKYVTNPYTQTNASTSYPNINIAENSKLTPEEIKKRIMSIKKEIHFKFNSSKIEPISQYDINENPDEILKNIAEIMIADSSIKLRIEGNCDERGTEEYNLALGQRRAIAVKRYLVERYGISSNRIDTLSYGESQPLNSGHNEYAWAQNRRDHFVFIR